MKDKQNKNIVAKLTRIKEELGVFGQPESRAELLKSVDELIMSLSRLRTELANASLESSATEIRAPLEQVIGFLGRAKSDQTLQAILSMAGIVSTPKPKRQPIEIPSNLSNAQVRALLQEDLSNAELKSIAAQRSISVAESSNAEIRRSILKNLDRQEGYERLGAF
jgi:hypothetical protein